MKAIKLKSQANVFVCQNKMQAMEAITEVGNSQREITRLETEINDITATAIDERKDRIDELRGVIETLSHGVDKLLDMLKGDRKLKKFVRVKEEINKDAILADPKAVKDIKGISISSGVEDFVIKPFEVETGE